TERMRSGSATDVPPNFCTMSIAVGEVYTPAYNPPMASDILIVYCTLPAAGEHADKARAIARILVEERLAACVSLIPQLCSIYEWQGQIHDDAEQLAIVKTAADRFEALRARIAELHPYRCPE